jgi:hypothetical protein
MYTPERASKCDARSMGPIIYSLCDKKERLENDICPTWDCQSFPLTLSQTSLISPYGRFMWWLSRKLDGRSIFGRQDLT